MILAGVLTGSYGSNVHLGQLGAFCFQAEIGIITPLPSPSDVFCAGEVTQHIGSFFLGDRHLGFSAWEQTDDCRLPCAAGCGQRAGCRDARS